MRFSQRMGIKPVSKAVQLESIDRELRNSLWNAFLKGVLGQLDNRPNYQGGTSDFEDFATYLWADFFKIPIDTIPVSSESTIKQLRDLFFNWNWHEVYDFIEFLASEKIESSFDSQSYIEAINAVLEREVSGYRFVGRVLVPITHEIELDTIEETLAQTSAITSLKGANIHLAAALEMLSDRKSPDYRNSIKESLSAVEATVRQITGESTLGDGLKRLISKGIAIDAQLKSGFEKHYAYGNNKNSGIRHSIVEEPQAPDFDDAKYMLVTCCAFINYLVGKMAKVGLSF